MSFCSDWREGAVISAVLRVGDPLAPSSCEGNREGVGFPRP
jgi:hypothetical protein